jgi:hypothetical protein
VVLDYSFSALIVFNVVDSPMITIHHVIPHPGFLRDTGSPEQALYIQGEFCPSSPLATVREPGSSFCSKSFTSFDEF